MFFFCCRRPIRRRFLCFFLKEASSASPAAALIGRRPFPAISKVVFKKKRKEKKPRGQYGGWSRTGTNQRLAWPTEATNQQRPFLIFFSTKLTTTTNQESPKKTKSTNQATPRCQKHRRKMKGGGVGVGVAVDVGRR